MAPRSKARSRAPISADSSRLWAPWRAVYVRVAADQSKRCIFCLEDRLTASIRRRDLILYSGPGALVMLNRYPYNNGHLMVAPRRHVATPEALTAAERAQIAEIIACAVERMRPVFRPDGFNIGANIGRSAGAGFAHHMHWHIVPRWEGDTNFMPVISSTRVLSQHLKESYALLSPIFKNMGAAVS